MEYIIIALPETRFNAVYLGILVLLCAIIRFHVGKVVSILAWATMFRAINRDTLYELTGIG